MPRRPDTPCKHPGCGRLVPYGTMYCEEHTPLHYHDTKITTVCCGKKDIWQSRDDAKAFFLKAIAMSEGSEQQRYAAIYTQLCLGKTECSDEVE